MSHLGDQVFVEGELRNTGDDLGGFDIEVRVLR